MRGRGAAAKVSNDSNIPWSLGIPAVTLGKNDPGQSGQSHSLDEWMDIEKAPMLQGMATSLATAKME